MSKNDPTGEYVSPEHLEHSRWLALVQLCEMDGGPHVWQDVSVRPEGSTSGFTMEVASCEVLEQDFAEGLGPHPRELLPPGDAFALSVERMAVYLARPFSSTEALGWAEALMGRAGIPVSSLEEVGREVFYAAPEGTAAVPAEGPTARRPHG